MIVISSDLTLAPVATEPLAYPVIGWQNIATSINLSSDTEDEDAPLSNLFNPSTNLFWRGVLDSPAAAENITIDLTNYLEDVDYLAIARHNLAGRALSVEYLDTTDSPEEWVTLVEFMPADNAPILFRFTPAVYAGLRLVIPAGDEAPEIAVLYIGKLLVFEQGVQGDYTPLTFGRVTTRVAGVAEAGDYLGIIITSSHAESSASFRNLTPAWVRTYLDPFLEVSAVQPFFFAWSPEAYPDEVGFAWLENNAQPAFNVDGYTSVDFVMTGILS